MNNELVVNYELVFQNVWWYLISYWHTLSAWSCEFWWKRNKLLETLWMVIIVVILLFSNGLTNIYKTKHVFAIIHHDESALKITVGIIIWNTIYRTTLKFFTTPLFTHRNKSIVWLKYILSFVFISFCKCSIIVWLFISCYYNYLWLVLPYQF